MQTGTSFFKSKIARRFFVLFVGCAFFPIMLLTGYSYLRVEEQLYQQSRLRMDKDCKVYGMALMDRLIYMTNIMRICASSLANNQTPTEALSAIQDQVSTTFDGLGLYQAGSGLVTLFGHLNLEPDINLFNTLVLGQGKPTLYTGKPGDPTQSIYLLVPYSDGRSQGLLVAQPIPSVLWAIGVNSMLPAMAELAVYDEKGQRIVGTEHAPGMTLPTSSSQAETGNYLQFDYEEDGETYLASGWPLFMKSHFSGQTWTVVLSGARSNMLSAMIEFNRVFPWIVALAFWIVLILSLYSIRKTLKPLQTLKQGTERVGNQDFTTRVEINSNDEFELLADSFNTMTGQLNKQFNTLALMGDINRSILSSIDSSVIIPRSLRLIADFFSSQIIMLAQRTNEDPNRIRLTTLKGNHRNDLNDTFVLLNDEEQILFSAEKPYSVLKRDGFIPRFLMNETTIDSFLMLPLNSGRHAIGALILDLSDSSGKNATEQISQAQQLADQLGIALSNAHLVSDLERLSIGTVEALARTVDAKSKWTAGHSERVADLAVKIGEAMNWSSDRLELLFRGGLLHDIGKIGIPVSLLDKPGKLTEEEYDTVKTHPTIGGKILEPIQVYQDILPLVIQHHERFDGKGYPKGLSGKNIDIGARILCVADVYDALISQRPYREGWVKESVLNFMRDNRNTMFDPEVVDVFLALDI